MLALLRLFMSKSKTSFTSEDSRKMVRYWIKLFAIFVLLTIIEISGIVDVPGQWDLDMYTGYLFCGVFLGMLMGGAAVHGWPELLSEEMELSPKLQYEEEEED